MKVQSLSSASLQPLRRPLRASGSQAPADQVTLKSPLERAGAGVVAGLGSAALGAVSGAAASLVGLGAVGLWIAGAAGLGLATAAPEFIAAGAVAGALLSGLSGTVAGAASGEARPRFALALGMGAAAGGIAAPALFLHALNVATRGY